MKKARIDIKPSESLVLSTLIRPFVDRVDPDTSEKMKGIMKYFEGRGDKPYSFLSRDDIEICWKAIKICNDDELMALSRDDTDSMLKVFIQLARILDNVEGTVWREFT